MGLFSKKKKDDNLVTTQLKFLDGLDLFFKGEIVELIYNKDTEETIIQSKFKDKKSKEKKSYTIDNVARSEFVAEKDIIEKSKSVGGRAVLGGLILGPLGALVGGATGIGTKKKEKMNNYIVINTTDEQVIIFDVPATNFNYNKVIELITP